MTENRMINRTSNRNIIVGLTLLYIISILIVGFGVYNYLNLPNSDRINDRIADLKSYQSKSLSFTSNLNHMFTTLSNGNNVQIIREELIKWDIENEPNAQELGVNFIQLKAAKQKYLQVLEKLENSDRTESEIQQELEKWENDFQRLEDKYDRIEDKYENCKQTLDNCRNQTSTSN